jgi:hypothetical protein
MPVTATTSLTDILEVLNNGRAWIMPTTEVYKVIAFVNEFEPEMKIDAEINYAPGKTRIKKK